MDHLTALLVEDLIDSKFLEIAVPPERGRQRLPHDGYVCRDQAEKIPDRVALRFEKRGAVRRVQRGRERYANLLKRRGVGRATS
jgi:hypothetical protein